MFKRALFFAFLLFSFFAPSQDSTYTRAVIEALTSKKFAGRGYVDSGHVFAAQFIATEFEKEGLQKWKNSYFQKFYLNPNVFPSAMEIQIDEHTLIPGNDFIVSPSCSSVSGTYKLVFLNKAIIENKKKRAKFMKKNNANCFIVLDRKDLTTEEEKRFAEQEIYTIKAKGIIELKDNKLTWSITQKQNTDLAIIEIPREKISLKAKKITLNIIAEHKRNVPTQNVIGYITGTHQTDSFIVFSAHYDHLGKMGSNTYFPGANDNASGTSMLLNLVKYFSKNPPKYTVVFIAFSGEEIGLLGSFYYVEHPLFPLKNITFLVNVDIIGDAGDGITVVNGKIFEKQYQQLLTINKQQNYLPSIQMRGEAANSDHYPFYKKQVPCFFIYGRGKSTAYHDVNDTFTNLRLKNYSNCFNLIKDFVLLQQ